MMPLGRINVLTNSCSVEDAVTLVPFAPGDEPHLLLGRGYTGHEHLPWFGLANMNACLYDPEITE